LNILISSRPLHPTPGSRMVLAARHCTKAMEIDRSREAGTRSTLASEAP
jgi:hypothetical protein